jgi:divalent anion:Na+ symporter, DASS family
MQRKRSFLIPLFIGVGLWFLPHSSDIPQEAWHLLSIFVATIVGVILKPFPMGALSLMAMCVAILTNTLTLQESLGGFHNPIVWLVVFAFFISRGFIKTGLGARIAYYFLSILGKKTVGLSYGLLLSDLLLAPAIPSVTARAGGVVFPIAKGLAKTFGSDPETGTQHRIGTYLMLVSYQGSVITSAMFLTAMAANPFLLGITQEAGFNLSWGQWALAGLVPGLIALALMPLIVIKLFPPEIKATPDATKLAKRHLTEMGRLSFREGLMLAIFVLLLVLWISGDVIGLNATTAALCGLVLMLLFQILEWREITHEAAAWDTFVWFATLIMLATNLNKLGFTPWLSDQMVSVVGGMHWIPAFTLLSLVYFYAHYFFASNTAHVGAMYPAFLAISLGLGTPPFFAILVFAFMSSLAGGLTHYGSGPAPLYYGSGYVDVKQWWSAGFILSIVNLVIFIGLGSLWWRFVGLI